MLAELEQFFKHMRPAFSREATYAWFIIVFVGFLTRCDTYGVSSIIRALSLAPVTYPCLLNFFHSRAWSVDRAMSLWWEWLMKKNSGYWVNGRLVLAGDHTKIPKDARKMPAVATLHQDSETGSKPSFFRGHHWGCISMLFQAGDKFSSTPLWATIQEGDIPDEQLRKQPKTIRIVKMAQRISSKMECRTYLILDAYFASGSVFETASEGGIENKQVEIITRAKKNVVAYCQPKQPKKNKRGRKRKYGKKLKLMSLFDSNSKTFVFQTGRACIYKRTETIRYLCLDLLWKPTKGVVRFVLVESSRGRIIIMTSDLNLDPIKAVELYCRRVTIETMFDTLKNTLGGLAYHFWSQYLSPASRKPKKNEDNKQSSVNPKSTENTFCAIEKFVNVQLLVLGMLQLIAASYPDDVKDKAKCWLRTYSSNIPSEFVSKMALTNLIKANLCGYAKDLITTLIKKKQETPYEDVA